MPIDAQKPVGDSAPSISFNLTGINDWSPAMPFLDLMKTSRPWFGQDNDVAGWGDISHEQMVAGGHIDAQGWVRSLPRGVEFAETIFDWGASPESAAHRAGRYVISYEGEGDIQVAGGAQVVSREAGRIVIDNPRGSTFSVLITDPDARDNGNYIRNVTLVAEKNMPLFEAGAIFNPNWIEIVKDAADLRFMDWGKTNNSTLRSWSDRPQVDDMSYTGEYGVPLEVMIELCNQTGADLWYNIPHRADDEFVRNAAEMIRDKLDPRLSAHIEYSNEAWNFAFEQARYMMEMAQKTFGNDHFFEYQSYRATQVAMIFDSVFERGQGDAPELVNVYGAHTANTWLFDTAFKAASWQDEIRSGNMKAPAEVFDQIGVTSYFGGMFVTDAGLRAQLLNMIRSDVPQQQINSWMHRIITDPSVGDSVPALQKKLLEWKAVAEKYGMELTAYEGGQHTHHSFFVSGLTDAQANELSGTLADFVRSPEMADLYVRTAQVWKQVSDEPFMQFGEVSIVDRWGSWGILSHLEDNNPRYEALTGRITDLIGGESDPAHQSGIYHYGTGADEVIRGTPEEDFISAAGGNDRIILGGGNDGVHGGSGTDTVVVDGSVEDYVLRFRGDAAFLVGNGATVRLVDVERLTFDDMADVEVSRDGLPTTSKEPPARGEFSNARGKHVDYSDGDRAARDDGSDQGLTFRAVTRWSDLGRELAEEGWATGAMAYAVHDARPVHFKGVGVAPDYWSIMNNRQKSDPRPLTEGATNTALKFGDVVINAGELTGTSGSDSFFGRTVQDILNGGAGNDTMEGRYGDDRLSGDDGNDRLSGGEGNDRLNGGAGADRLDGDAGNDRLVGGAGSDRLSGGAGADQFVFAAGETGADTVTDFRRADGDTVLIRGAAADDLSFRTNGSRLEMTYDDGATVVFEGVDNQAQLRLVFEME